MSKFKLSKYVYINDLSMINETLEKLKIKTQEKKMFEMPFKVASSLKESNEAFQASRAYQINVKYTQIEVSYYNNKKGYVTEIFKLDGSLGESKLNGLQAFTMLQKMSNKGVDDMTNTEFYDKICECFTISTIGGFTYKNPKYIGNRYTGVYSYDVNSSYSFAMLKDIPDTKGPMYERRELQDGEIGFNEVYENGQLILKAIFTKGTFCRYIFKAIKSPFDNFVKKYYNIKCNAPKDSKERQRAKDMLNIATGYIRRKNPFLHSCILSRARDYIKQFINEDTLVCNTDSIISLTPRYDLNIGKEIGQFKLEHTNETFAYSKTGYQWNNEQPKINGKSKQWFKNEYPNGFDILKDKLPNIESNKYIYNKETMQVEINPKYEEQ